MEEYIREFRMSSYLSSKDSSLISRINMIECLSYKRKRRKSEFGMREALLDQSHVRRYFEK